MDSAEGTTEDVFVDAATDLDGAIRKIVAEQTTMMEARLRSWMEQKMDGLLQDMRSDFRRELNKVLTGYNKNAELLNKKEEKLDRWIEEDDDWKADFVNVMNEIQDRYDKFPAFVKRVEARLNTSLAEICGALAGIQRTEQTCKRIVAGLGRVNILALRASEQYMAARGDLD